MKGAKVSSSPISTKQIVFSVLFMAASFLIVRLTFLSSNVSESQTSYMKTQNCPSNFNKLPPSLSDVLVHYATTNITPQQIAEEINLAKHVLQRKSPCNFLVFGLGFDSLMWAALNHGGKTVFLEESEIWISNMESRFPMLKSMHVTYHTKVRDSEALLASAKSDKECDRVVDPRESKCELALKQLPAEIYETEWDLIMVDAPTGYSLDAPGRMQAIYTAGLLGRNREDGETDVFVHDVDRPIEDVFSKAFLCKGYMIEEASRLRRFTIPSHKTRVDLPFCPTI